MHVMDEDDAPVQQQQGQEAQQNDGRPAWIRSLEATVTALVPLMPAVRYHNTYTPHTAQRTQTPSTQLTANA